MAALTAHGVGASEDAKEMTKKHSQLPRANRRTYPSSCAAFTCQLAPTTISWSALVQNKGPGVHAKYLIPFLFLDALLADFYQI